MSGNDPQQKLTRRHFLRTMALGASTALLAACAGAPAAPTSGPTAAPAATAVPPTLAPTVTPAAAPTPLPAVAAAPTAVPIAAPAQGTLVFAAEAVGDSLEPGLWNGFGCSNVIDNIYDKLTRPGDNWSDPPRGALAESWEISADQLTYTFKLRSGVTFHDGTELKSDSIVRSLTRVVNEQEPSYVKGMYMNAEFGQANWEKIEAVDDMTVKLVLKSPDAAQLYRLFHPAAGIMSAASLDKYKADVGLNPVGAGPFKLSKFTPGQEATLAAFDGYWDGGSPPLKQVVVRGYPDEASMIAAIEASEVNFAPYPPSSAIERLSKDARFVVEPGPPLVSTFLGLNRLQKPMDNKDVRLAINYAIDRQNLIDGALYGLGELPGTILGPTEFGFDPSTRDVSKQDIEKAKEHVAKSGLPTPIEITFSFENNRFWPLMAELIKADLEAVGFKVTLEKMEAGAYSNKVYAGKTQINMTQRSLWVPDPDNKVRLLHKSQGQAQFETGIADTPFGEEISVLIDAGRAESDLPKRAEIYKQIQKMMLDEMPYVTLAYYKKPIVVAKDVKVAPASAVSSERIFLHRVSIG
ncbi:MAG: ABC transporter substrate-binding protein [Roseiflexaceae bacterium]|nr:ABC transporter substrate-binding protein [Roseiflexaceae bacterium]